MWQMAGESPLDSNNIAVFLDYLRVIIILCWMTGLWLTMGGGVRLYKTFRAQSQPDFTRMKRAGLFRLLAGFGFLAFPFILWPCMMPSYYDGYFGGRHFSAYPVLSPEEFLQQFAAFCWYFGGMALFFGNLALSRALRNKDDPASVSLKEQAAVCMLSGFLITSVPFACSSFLGVALW